MKRQSPHFHYQVIIAIIIVLFILIDTSPPYWLSKHIDTIAGNLVVVFLAIGLFTHMGPIVGILGIIGAYCLIRRASKETGTYILRQNPGQVRAEELKTEMLRQYNHFPRTLEEDVVARMAPIIESGAENPLQEMVQGAPEPTLSTGHDAAEVGYPGVI